jgi:hypothetical protein
MECTFESMGQMIDEIWSKKVLVFRPEARQLQLQEETVDFDLVVHIGMQPSDDRICFESRAFRDHLNFRDLDGKELPAKYVGPGGLWEGLPDVLEPDLNIRMAAEEVAERFPVRIATSIICSATCDLAFSDTLKDIESRLSTDAGGYFCEFQFWASLAVLHKQGKRRTACFVHVPKKKDGEAIGNGVKATVAFIGALIESMES